MSDSFTGTRDVAEEPALTGSLEETSFDADSIGGEPALAENALAQAALKDHAVKIAEQWRRSESVPQAAPIFKMLCCSGLLAILCAFFGEIRNSSTLVFFSTVLIAPTVEEFGKILIPLMTLEKRPWRFSSDNAIMAVCLMSGFTFAVIENLLYLFIYIPKDQLTAGIVAFRLTACTALHMAGTAISGYGLSRCWRRAHDAQTEADLVPAMRWIIAAVVLHGFFNAGAIVYSIIKH